MVMFPNSILMRRLQTFQDPRGPQGIFSRGFAPNFGNLGGRPASSSPTLQQPSGFERSSPQPVAAQPVPFHGSGLPGQVTSWNPSFGNPSTGQPQQQPNVQIPSFQTPDLPEFGWSFNPQYAEALRQIQSMQGELTAGQSQSTRRAEEDYERILEELSRNRDLAGDQLRDQMAAQGILRSGINVGQQHKLGEQHQRGVTDVGGQHTRILEDIVRHFTQQQNRLEQERARLEMDRARDEQHQRMIEAERRARLEAEQRANTPQPSPSGTYQMPSMPSTVPSAQGGTANVTARPGGMGATFSSPVSRSVINDQILPAMMPQLQQSSIFRRLMGGGF